MLFDKDETHLAEFTINGAKLSDIQIEEKDLPKPNGVGMGSIENLSEYHVNFELTPESVKNLTILYGDTGAKYFKPNCKTNNWYKMHGYKMNRQIGRKWIARHMHELNIYIDEITKESDGTYHGHIKNNPNVSLEWHEVQHAEE